MREKSQSLSCTYIDAPGYDDSDSLAAPYTVVSCPHTKTITISLFIDFEFRSLPDGAFYIRWQILLDELLLIRIYSLTVRKTLEGRIRQNMTIGFYVTLCRVFLLLWELKQFQSVKTVFQYIIYRKISPNQFDSTHHA